MGTLTETRIRPARVPHDPTLTIGEALEYLRPKIPRRTLARILAGLTPAGSKPVKHGGPPAKTYLLTEVARVHADWARRKSQECS